jgi:hypothetical protein
MPSFIEKHHHYLHENYLPAQGQYNVQGGGPCIFVSLPRSFTALAAGAFAEESVDSHAVARNLKGDPYRMLGVSFLALISKDILYPIIRGNLCESLKGTDLEIWYAESSEWSTDATKKESLISTSAIL